MSLWMFFWVGYSLLEMLSVSNISTFFPGPGPDSNPEPKDSLKDRWTIIAKMRAERYGAGHEKA